MDACINVKSKIDVKLYVMIHGIIRNSRETTRMSIYIMRIMGAV